MKHHHIKFSRILVAILLLATIVLQAIPQEKVSAAAIFNRRITLMAGALDGGSKSGGVVAHKFDFTIPAGGSAGSILFEYCTTAADVGMATCVPPLGLDTLGATLTSANGITGMTLVPSATSFYLTRSPGGTFSLAGNTTVDYTIDGIINPEYGLTTPDTNKTFFVRISVFTSMDTSGASLHRGTVAASTAEPIILDGTMPESLVFCTGETINMTASVPDCSTATDGSISFNQLFSPITTASATSQMAASTNAGSGYVITVNGPTLTSGSNTINAMATAGPSNHGNSQFGMNLVANTIDANPIGGDINPVSNGTNLRGWAIPSSGYDVANTFKFVSGEDIANSGNSVLGGTDAQIYTVTYIANVTGSLPAGNYVTTLTYICTPWF